MSVAEKRRSMEKAMMKMFPSWSEGVFIISNSYIWPDRPRLKIIPSMIPLKIAIRSLIRIYTKTIILISVALIPTALSILNTEASSLHFPYVYKNRNIVLKIARMTVTIPINPCR